MDVMIVARTAAALSDPTRVMVYRLSDGKRPIAGIACELNVTPRDVRYHVARLAEVGLVAVVRRGRRRCPRQMPDGWRPLLRAFHALG